MGHDRIWPSGQPRASRNRNSGAGSPLLSSQVSSWPTLQQYFCGPAGWDTLPGSHQACAVWAVWAGPEIGGLRAWRSEGRRKLLEFGKKIRRNAKHAGGPAALVEAGIKPGICQQLAKGLVERAGCVPSRPSSDWWLDGRGFCLVRIELGWQIRGQGRQGRSPWGLLCVLTMYGYQAAKPPSQQAQGEREVSQAHALVALLVHVVIAGVREWQVGKLGKVCSHHEMRRGQLRGVFVSCWACCHQAKPPMPMLQANDAVITLSRCPLPSSCKPPSCSD